MYWKNIKIKERQKIIQCVNTLNKEAGVKVDIWTHKTYMLMFTELVQYKIITTIRIYHQIAKKHPGVIVGAPEDNKKNDQAPLPPKRTLESFILLPPKLIKDAKKLNGKEKGAA